MRNLSNYLSGALVLTSMLMLASCLLSGNTAEATIEKGIESCNIYEMPRGWRFPDGRMEPSYPEDLEFRVLPSRSGKVCASQRLQFKKLVATEMFCFGGSESELAPTDPSWENGHLLAVRRTEDRREFLSKHRELRKGFRGNEFVFLGRTYRKRGDEWYLDPNYTTDYRYLILQSQDEDNIIERNTTVGIFGPAQGNANSPVYIQVFDITTGRELIVVRYDLSGMFASTVLSTTGWLDNRTLLSMQTYSNKIMVCRLP